MRLLALQRRHSSRRQTCSAKAKILLACSVLQSMVARIPSLPISRVISPQNLSTTPATRELRQPLYLLGKAGHTYHAIGRVL